MKPLEVLFLERTRHHLVEEYRTKIRAAVEALPPDKLWWRANEQSNSAANLILHLNGNVRQWIVAGIGGERDRRDRLAEFAARGQAPASELLDDFDRTLKEVDGVLARVTPDQLLERRTVQGRDLTVMEIILHVVQHFAVHTGQIILLSKQQAPGGIRFTEDRPDGIARPLWTDLVRPISPTSP